MEYCTFKQCTVLSGFILNVVSIMKCDVSVLAN